MLALSNLTSARRRQDPIAVTWPVVDMQAASGVPKCSLEESPSPRYIALTATKGRDHLFAQHVNLRCEEQILRLLRCWMYWIRRV